MKTKERAKRRRPSVGPLECQGNCSDGENRPYDIDIEPNPVVGSVRTIELPTASARVATDGVRGSHGCVQREGAKNVSNVTYESGQTNIVVDDPPSFGECYHHMTDAMCQLPKHKAAKYAEGTQSADVANLANHVSCAQKSVPLLDKGKGKMCDIFHGQQPSTEDFIDTELDNNGLYLTCTENWDINADNETATLFAHSIQAERNLPSAVDLHSANHYSNKPVGGSVTARETQTSIVDESTLQTRCNLHSTIALENVPCSSKRGKRKRSTNQNADTSNVRRRRQKSNQRSVKETNAQIHRSQVRMYSSQQTYDHSSRTRNRRTTARQGPPDTYIHMGRPDKVCQYCNAIFWKMDSSIVPLSESKGKEIVTQQQNISLADLKTTDTDKAIYVRAYRKWTPTNRQGRPALFCCMLIDAQGGAIQANVNIREKPKFNALLQTNRTYRITGFGFQNAKTYMQVVPHSLSLAFGTYTDIKEIPDIDFPSHYFNFTQYRDLFSKIDVKEGMLTDYIGCVQYVSDLQHPVKGTPDSPIWRDIGIQNLDGRMVRFTLWNEDAHTFRKEEYEKAEKPVIIAVSSCLVKHYGGLQLSATNATHYYFNPKIPECTEIRSVYEEFVDPPAITNVQYQRFADPQQEKQRNRVKLADLISENPENQQNVRFTVIASITSIEKNRPWFFRKCHDCKLKISERLPHTHCKQPASETDFIYSYCFRVQLSDETGKITMTCFSNEANSMVKDCKQLLQTMTDQNPYEYPPEIIGLEGTRKIFQLHFDPQSTKEKQIFILDTCWDNLPLITAPVPALTETSANYPKQTASPDQLSMPEETKAPMPITHTKPEPPSPQTIAVVAEPTPQTKKEEPATTPVSDQPALAQASKPANQPARKTARKALFQGNPDTSTGGNAKKSKKED